MTSFPPGLARALSIKAAVRTGTINDVEHVVIFMQENRSFDHYFGTLKGVRGFGDPFPAPVADSTNVKGRNVWVQPTVNNAAPGAIAPFHLNTAQNFAFMRVSGTPPLGTDAQAAWDHGRMGHWPKAKQNHSMGYFQRSDMPFQFALADAFTICDAYHCASHGGTNTNRLFHWTGTNDPLRKGNGPSTDNSHDSLKANPATDYTWTTYPERLQAAGISWQVYENMSDNFYRKTPGRVQGVPRRVVRARGLLAGAEGSRRVHARPGPAARRRHQQPPAGRVLDRPPPPRAPSPPGPSSPAQGAAYTARVLDALTADPEVWSRTALLLMFDENDGFFDHMPPPAAPSYVSWNADPAQAVLAGASTVDFTGEHCEILNGASATYLHRPYGMGPRVPMYVVSPWSKGGWVNSQVFDHTSVLRFLEARFGVAEPNISAWRRAVAGDLTSCFNFADPEDSEFFSKLPTTVALANKARALPGTTTPPAPTALQLPTQNSGVRPARALPYDLQATAALASGAGPNATAVAVSFQNTGRAAAVFHFFDRLRLGDIPRRYKRARRARRSPRSFAPSATGAYDLWVLGPNGFHRHFAGESAARRGGRSAQPGRHRQGQPGHRRAAGDAGQHRPRGGELQRRAQQVPEHRADDGQRARAQPQRARLSIAASAFWYDVSVRVNGQADYLRRFAGHVETGAPSISDPAMEGLAGRGVRSACRAEAVRPAKGGIAACPRGGPSMTTRRSSCRFCDPVLPPASPHRRGSRTTPPASPNTSPPNWGSSSAARPSRCVSRWCWASRPAHEAGQALCGLRVQSRQLRRRRQRLREDDRRAIPRLDDSGHARVLATGGAHGSLGAAGAARQPRRQHDLSATALRRSAGDGAGLRHDARDAADQRAGLQDAGAVGGPGARAGAQEHLQRAAAGAADGQARARRRGGPAGRARCPSPAA
ncbi:phosphoesterase family domain-containing protein [Ditylenchus destructor]|nr:phosphoesterase family domain-containing protein [Ditylenchus destructor]